MIRIPLQAVAFATWIVILITFRFTFKDHFDVVMPLGFCAALAGLCIKMYARQPFRVALWLLGIVVVLPGVIFLLSILSNSEEFGWLFIFALMGGVFIYANVLGVLLLSWFGTYAKKAGVSYAPYVFLCVATIVLIATAFHI
ncbi:MAG: hypothetical protein OXR66_08315 [Candidatus Woesearchaeota archaeon]|nr:hypothetical protein [Candidatus Woesearchaeota archaeon]